MYLYVLVLIARERELPWFPGHTETTARIENIDDLEHELLRLIAPHYEDTVLTMSDQKGFAMANHFNGYFDGWSINSDFHDQVKEGFAEAVEYELHDEEWDQDYAIVAAKHLPVFDFFHAAIVPEGDWLWFHGDQGDTARIESMFESYGDCLAVVLNVHY